MNNEQVYKSVLSGKAILITGSGAHMGVMTPNGEPFPSGISMANNIYKLCGIEYPENPWDLQDATDTYVEKFSEESLVQQIKKQLMVGSVRDEHRELYSCDWQRIYTTNYDEVPQISTSKNLNTLIPKTLNSVRKEADLQEKLCIYINGYIGRLTTKTLRDEFKLTGRSYLSANELIESEWGAVFSDDIDTADCIVIVGLSLDYDLDLKRFIYNKSVIDKTVFIESPDISLDKKRKMERLGTVEPIGIKQFVDGLIQFKNNYDVKPQNQGAIIYKSFNVYEQKKSLKKATSINVYDMLKSGEITDDLWYRENGKYVHIVYRKKIYDVIECLKANCKVIYLHANLGNGKTLFIESLKHQLQRSDYKIFTLNENYQGVTVKEIKNIIDEKGKKIIIIENFYNYISVIRHFSIYDLENVQFVFSARSVLYDTRLTEVNDLLKINAGEAVVFDLNRLLEPEISAMNKILNENGLWGKYSSKTDTEKKRLLRSREFGNMELQAILIGIIKSTSIKQRLEDMVKKIKKMSGEYYDVLILALLIKTMSLNISASDMSKILKINTALDANFINNASVREILDFSDKKYEFKLRSAVTANMILNELNCNEEIIKVLKKTAKYANQYRRIERYENILKNIISYSHVRTFLKKSNQKDIFLLNYYDDLKEFDYYKENSFYWLQYSIACSNVDKYELAQTYLDNAYTWFRDTDEIVPFQIDTQQARLHLLIIEKGLSKDVKEDFIAAHRLLMKPVVSQKDNPAKQISIFKSYISKSIRNSMNAMGCEELYRECCGEAYNKVSQYLKNVRIEDDKERFKSLSRELLRNSV